MWINLIHNQSKMRYFLLTTQIPLCIVICFNIISFLVQETSGDKYCLETYDPTCYFPDDEPPQPSRIMKRYDKVRKLKGTLKLKNGDIFSDGGLSIREKRAETTSEPSAPGKDDSTTTKDGSDPEEGEDGESPSSDLEEPLGFSSVKGILHPHLQQYSKKDLEWVYPPWTYHGFYSPKEWHEIPQWYFLPKEDQKKGKYTGKTANKKSGISFMDFKEIWKPNIFLPDGVPEKVFKSKEEELEAGGVHSYNCSNTRFPSPLDILTGNAREDAGLKEFNFENEDTLYSFMMFFPEDGTDLLFVKLQVPTDKINLKPAIEKGATTGNTLYLDRILIHYGMNPNEGSEHRINGRKFGMELQFFFNKQTKATGGVPYFNTLENYISDRDSSQFGKNLMVLCILVEVADRKETIAPSGKEYNKGMKYLAMAAEQFWATKNTKKFRTFAVKKKVLKMGDFFKVPTSGLYYTYYGSLTHPPCLNNTRYAVYEKPIYIKHKDWRKFLFIPSIFSDTQFVAGNFRNMDTMKLTSNVTNTIVPYDSNMKMNLSYTVRKSRRATEEEISLEYDYYEDGTGLLGHGSAYINKCFIQLLLANFIVSFAFKLI